MKKKSIILLLLISGAVFGQGITISSLTVKHVLPADVSQWGADAVNGIATGRADTDGVRMAINILRNGNSFVCGTTFENAQDMPGFATKVIRISDAAGALGDCLLAPGDYRLCVQFFSAGLPDVYEACRDFSVASSVLQHEQQPQTTVEYSVPNLMAPADGSIIKGSDSKKPIALRWTPVVPPAPPNDLIYTIRVYELLKGQKPEQALRGNQPILDLPLRGQTQTIWTIPGGTENIENRQFVWNVRATNREGKPYGKNNGMSENWIFDRWGNEGMRIESAFVLSSPADGTIFRKADVQKPLTLKWTATTPLVTNVNYNVRIYELLKGQKSAEAIKGNRPIFEKQVKGLTQATWQMPIESIEKRTFVWYVQATDQQGKAIGPNGGMSEYWSMIYDRWAESGFIINTPKPTEGSACVPGHKPTIDKISCEGGQIMIYGHIQIKEDSVEVEDISITGIKDTSEKDIINNYYKLPEKIKKDNKGYKFQFEISGQSCGKDVMVEYQIDSHCKESENTKTKGKIIIPAKDLKCCEAGTESECKNNPILNGDFLQGAVSGTMPAGQVANWKLGYANAKSGKPMVDNTVGQGADDQGYVILKGNKTSGNAIAQSFNSSGKLTAGKKYTFTIAVRFNKGQELDYAKIRLIAYNGALPQTGNHPAPQTDIALIGMSGKILDYGQWSFIEFPAWKANKDFSNIAINAFTDYDDVSSIVFIDNISACETTGSDCAELQIDSAGNPIFPEGTASLPPDLVPTEVQDENYYNGSLPDLYGYDGTPAMYSNSEECFSLGEEEVPAEAQYFDCDASLKAAGIDMTCEELHAMMGQPFEPMEVKIQLLPALEPIVKDSEKCRMVGPKDIEKMVFHGRDLIYIHGLDMSHLIGRAGGSAGATGHWPLNKSEYLKPGGYYYKAAEKYMGPHMGHYLHPGRGYLDNLNRTLIVSYDCSEPAEVAIHAVLTQISDAMKYGTNVQASKLDPRGTNCFGRDYIMISHSTGALIADVALSIANQTKTDEILKVKYGDIGLISERCKGRISIQGAYSGSNLARIACTASSASPALFSIAIRGLAAVQNIDLDSSIGPNIVSWNNTISTAINPYLISNSILVDLTPSITRQRWASYLDKVTVPVFTMVGGHPSAVLGQLKYSIHPGYDDGVLTMDSANAGMNSITITSNISADHKKIFDKGIEHKRAVKYYHDIHNGFAEDGFASASIPNLTPTGMIIPITAINSNPQNHFRNHYSFLMAAKEHFLNATEGWALSNNYFHEYARTGEHIINDEEVLVTNDATLYSGGLINPAILNEMGETKIGRYYELPVIRIKWRNGRLRINLVWLKYHLWERTYHKLQNPNLYDCDYAYKYLFPN